VIKSKGVGINKIKRIIKVVAPKIIDLDLDGTINPFKVSNKTFKLKKLPTPFNRSSFFFEIKFQVVGYLAYI
jgi:hypothetical protein